MRNALVLGVNGQDGGYLAEALIRRQYAVIGVGRQPTSRHVPTGDAFRYVSLELKDTETLAKLLQVVAPDVAFHVAAVHGAAGFSYEAVWREMMAVNVLALHVLLDYARERRAGMRVIYAGSSKIFPAPWSGTIDETTAYRPTCLYGIGKISSLELIAHYRRNHGIAASNLIMFNHESVRRDDSFFVPRIARALSAALTEAGTQVEVRTLDFWSDWSAADELMDIAIDICERAPHQDFILASGHTWHARAAIDAIFARYGHDYHRHIREVLPPLDPGPTFKVSVDRLAQAIGRRPRKSIFEIVDSMCGVGQREPASAPPNPHK